MGIGKRLKESRENAGLTQEELGRRIGVTGSAITNYEKETSHPKEPIMYALMEVLKVEPNFLFQDCVSVLRKESCDDELSSEEIIHIKKYRALDSHGKEMVDSALEIEYRRVIESLTATEPEEDNIVDISLAWSKASAGTGFDLIEEESTPIKVRYNDLTRKADFCVGVEGHSMEPTIMDGDIILVRKQPAVNVGEIGLFTINDEGFVKEQGEERLISTNPEYEDIYPNEYDIVRCCGKVVGVLQPEWIVEK